MLLEGKLVVLTRGETGNQAWAAHLARYGATTYSLPSIITRPAAPAPQLTQALSELKQFDWLIFTSAAGVHYAKTIFARLYPAVPPADLPQIAVVGDKTAAAARTAGLSVAWQPPEATAAALARGLPVAAGCRILVLRANIAPGELAHMLSRRGAAVTDLPVYQTHLQAGPEPAFSQLLQAGLVHYLTFASPSAVRGFAERVTPADLALSRPLPAIALGPSVTMALEQANFSAVYQVARPNIQAVCQILLRLAGQNTL